jgi:hypothetical protein
MKILFQISLLLCFVSCAGAQEPGQNLEKTFRIYDWQDLAGRHGWSAGDIVSMDGISVLKIENTNNQPLEVSLLSITNSSVIKKAEFISFDMKYENVSKEDLITTNHGGEYDFKLKAYKHVVYGQLQLVTHFPPLTLGGDEITNIVSPYPSYVLGTSNWKPYGFHVDRAEPEGLPTQLELKLSLPGNGTIYLRPIKLSGVVGSWWSTGQSGMVGGAVGIFGGVLGCFGGLLGCLAGFGKARKFVLTTTKIFIALGMLLTMAGIAAIICGQPYFVWYVFLLPGIILTLVFSLNFPMIQKRYDDLEIRRMASMDAMRG